MISETSNNNKTECLLSLNSPEKCFFYHEKKIMKSKIKRSEFQGLLDHMRKGSGGKCKWCDHFTENRTCSKNNLRFYNPAHLGEYNRCIDFELLNLDIDEDN